MPGTASSSVVNSRGKIPAAPRGHPFGYQLKHKFKKISQSGDLKQGSSATERLFGGGGQLCSLRKNNQGRHHGRGDIYMRALVIKRRQPCKGESFP